MSFERMRWPLCVLRSAHSGVRIMTTLKTGDRNKLDKKAFAYRDERKEPPENAAQVRNAIARINQVKGVCDSDRDAAW